MIAAIDNGILLEALDAQTFNILNCHELLGADNVVYSTDASLTNTRLILDGTVTDESVSEDAGIVQSKLSLNGNLPSDWLGTTEKTAAEGDLVQFKSELDQANGYPSLDVNSKLPTGSVPVSGTGTVKKIDIDFDERTFTTLKDVSTSDKVFTVIWNTVPPVSWFGNEIEDTRNPHFITTPFPLSLIPDFDAAQFVYSPPIFGTFDPKRFELAIGVGAEHQSGIIPIDPTEDGMPEDYLARDMTFKKMDTSIPYQPVISDPAITILYYIGPVAIVNITESVKNTNLFYKFSTMIESASFMPITLQPLQVPIGTTIMVYASKVGYTNSKIMKLTIPDPGN